MINEENGYFRQVIKDAIKDLKKKGSCIVFFEEQIQSVIEYFGDENIKINYDGSFYYLSLTKKLTKCK